MSSRVKVIGVSSDLHRRIVNTGIRVNDLDLMSGLVVISTSIQSLFQYTKDYCGPYTIIWMLLDAADLAFHYETVRPLLSEICQAPKVDFSIYGVGNLGGKLSSLCPSVPVRLLYDQEKSRHLFQSFSQGINLFPKSTFKAGLLYYIRDFIRHPRLCLGLPSQKENLVVFTGQTGFATAIKSLYALGMNQRVKQLEYFNSIIFPQIAPVTMREISTLWMQLRDLSFEILKQSVQNSSSIHSKVFHFILSRSLLRILQLSALQGESRFILFLYPTIFLNICSWPRYLAPISLDLGGINGTEPIYPRSADLLARGHRVISVSPHERYDHFGFNESLLQDEIALCKSAIKAVLHKASSHTQTECRGNSL